MICDNPRCKPCVRRRRRREMLVMSLAGGAFGAALLGTLAVLFLQFHGCTP